MPQPDCALSLAGVRRQERRMTRTWIGAAALLALLVLPAEAQMGRHSRGDDNAKASDQKKTKVDENAYKEALKRIPEPKEKYDPWGGARPTDQKAK
jgi:hypothetical protein